MTSIFWNFRHLLSVGSALIIFLNLSGGIPVRAAHADESTQPNLQMEDFEGQSIGDFFKKFHWFFKGLKKGSHYEDVKTWKPLGLRFVAGYDVNGNLLAIYDLSYPTLGTVINLGKISKDVMSGEEFRKGLELAKEVAMKDTRNSPAAIAQAVKAIGDISPLMDVGRLFTQKWWKEVHWKNKLMGLSEEAPNRFQMSDIEVGSGGIPPVMVGALKKLFNTALTRSEEPGERVELSEQEVLSTFTWVKNTEGYEVQWANPFRHHVPRPRKLVDLRENRTGLIQNLEIAALWEGLSATTAYIPVPIVQSIVSTAFSRFHHYLELTHIEHMEMVVEMLAAADEGATRASPFSVLSPSEIQSSIVAVQYGITKWSASWEWFFKFPLEDWKKQRDRDIDCAEKAHKWLQAQSQVDSAFNTRFIVGTDAYAHSRLYLTSEVCVKNGREPVVSIDYANPDIERLSRAFLEIFSTGVHFATHLIPTAGSLASGVYSFLIESPYEGTRRWEARLMSHLEERQRSGESNQWEKELQILQAQRLNPFEIDRPTMLELIRERRQAIGIQADF